MAIPFAPCTRCGKEIRMRSRSKGLCKECVQIDFNKRKEKEMDKHEKALVLMMWSLALSDNFGDVGDAVANAQGVIGIEADWTYGDNSGLLDALTEKYKPMLVEEGLIDEDGE